MPELLRETRPTARKEHVCQMCGGPIQPGETYRRDTYKADDLYDFLTCNACEKDGIVNEVYAWADGGIWGDGVTDQDAWEWAHDTDSPAARALLVRCGCGCESCETASVTKPTEYEENEA